MIFKFEPEVNAGQSYVDESQIDEDFLDEIAEEFIDTVFGEASKLYRKEYMDIVAKKANWIFSGKAVRDRINKKKELY